MEFLVVGEEHFLGGLIVDGGGEDLLAQLVQGNIGDPCHPLRGADIPDGAGGGLEHNGVGNNGRSHHTRHLLRRHQAPILEHGGNDGIGGAHRLIADIDGGTGLDVCQTVVIDDLQDLRLLQTGHGLGSLVVVHQHHPLPTGPQQMIPGQNAYYLFLLVQNGVAMLPVLQNLLLHIIQPILQMEAGQILGAADPADGGGLENQSGCPIGIEGGGDDAGGGGIIHQLLADLRLAQHHAVHVHIQSPADHIGLVAAEDDGFFPAEQQVLPALGQSNGDLTLQGVHVLTGLVEDLSLQHGKHVEQGHLIQHTQGDQGHIVAGHILPGQHTVKGAVLVHHRQSGNFLVLLKHTPGTALGNGGA